MHMNDIPLRQQKQLPDISPTTPMYIVTDMTKQRQAVMDDLGGQHEFGDAEWKLIRSNEHPDIDCEPLEVTIH